MSSEDPYTSYAEEDDELEEWPGDPRTPSRRFHRRALTSDSDPDADADEDEYELPLPLPADGDEDELPAQGFATHTAFDAYFQLAAKPARTSSNVFSTLLPAPSAADCTAALAAHRVAENAPGRRPQLWADARARADAYRRFRTELSEGFSLLFYGCGSKRAVLNGLAAFLAERGGHVVVANGFQPAFAFRDLVGAIERVPGVVAGAGAEDDAEGGEGVSGGLDAQVQRIHAFFSRPPPPAAAAAAAAAEDDDDDDDLPHLYIIIHNIEGAAFRAPKHRAALALLALAPRIHLAASFDHAVGTPLRWSLAELFARKPAPRRSSPSSCSSAGDRSAAAQPRGFAWLWHDLTTLAPYDFEFAYAVDPTVLTGAAALRGARASASASASLGALRGGGIGAAAGGAGGAGAMTESAAGHILASVTQKAKKLFVLLGAKQLEVMLADARAQPGAGDRAGEEDGGGGGGEGGGAYDYDRLFAAARDNFVAQNDTALRALLGEFRDHGLVVSVAAAVPGGGSGSGEALWIPLRREALMKVLADLRAEGA
ncbi:origin recognition complex subunit 2-domain-containing protein [Trametes gibbosa]|nr:origin recognition complex subunit 2-domain-containing protein [Trametes gibbosa]